MNLQHWNRLPGEVVESPCQDNQNLLGCFPVQLSVGSLLEQGGGLGDLQRSLPMPQFCESVITQWLNLYDALSLKLVAVNRNNTVKLQENDSPAFLAGRAVGTNSWDEQSSRLWLRKLGPE